MASNPRKPRKLRPAKIRACTVPQPSAIQQYNCFMGGVEKSDQYIQYHRILRQTKKYWKTLFYHTIEIGVTNAFLLHQWKRMMDEKKRITENTFRDNLVNQLSAYLEHEDTANLSDVTSTSEENSTSMDITVPYIKVFHGSRCYSRQNRCSICSLKTTRRCPDCPGKPPLCQTSTRDCLSKWHGKQGLVFRRNWVRRRKTVPIRQENKGRPNGSQKKGLNVGYSVPKRTLSLCSMCVTCSM